MVSSIYKCTDVSRVLIKLFSCIIDYFWFNFSITIDDNTYLFKATCILTSCTNREITVLYFNGWQLVFDIYCHQWSIPDDAVVHSSNDNLIQNKFLLYAFYFADTQTSNNIKLGVISGNFHLSLMSNNMQG